MNLIEAFKNTDYIVNGSNNKQIVINIDNLHPELDTFISPALSWCFITAYNPLPLILEEEENIERNNLLIKDVLHLGNTFHTALGISKTTDWQEESIFVVGISKEKSINLGRKYGQKAIVFGTKSNKAELIMLT